MAITGQLTDLRNVPAGAITGAAALSLYSLMHAVVDTCSAATVLLVVSCDAVDAGQFVALMVLYHALAFGLQPLVGLAVDAAGGARFAAVAGCLIAAGPLMIHMPPEMAIAVTGVGNAIFHVGGGVLAMRLTPDRAVAPGVFVATGSLGLLLGVILGKQGSTAVALLPAIALVLATVLACVPANVGRPMAIVTKPARRGDLVLGLILLAIAARSLLGFVVNFRWETQPVALLAVAVATFLGKVVGGLAADRFGWRRVAVGATLLGWPFLCLASALPLAAVPGLFLLNMMMPVTLVATARILPNKPGFAFGLTCLALLVGAIPSLFGVSVKAPPLVSLVVVISVASLDVGLQHLRPSVRSERAIQVPS
ncbi:MAG: hypothetical protein ABFC96_08220 [Thermoguttaceae bacterium]